MKQIAGLDGKTNSLVMGLFLIILGLVAIVMKGGAVQILIVIAGLLLLVIGALAVYYSFKDKGQEFVIGVVQVVIGIVLIVGAGLLTTIAMYILGIALIILGAVSLLDILKSKDFKGNIIPIIVGAVMVIAGILALVNPAGMIDTIMLVIGILVVISGLLEVVGALKK